MHARTVVIALAALILCPAPRLAAQPLPSHWAPRRMTQAPIRKMPFQPTTSRAQTRPIVSKKVSPTGPIVKRPATQASSHNRALDWYSAMGAPSVGYRAYDTEASLDRAGYYRTPGIGEGNAPKLDGYYW